MQTHAIQLSDVIYNAATQSYEALVTVHDGGQTRRYACAIDAPITMAFRDAAQGLRKQALRRHASRGGIYSEIRQTATPPRAGRPKFDPVRWLEQFVDLPGRHAA